jgi:glutathione S-transferase
MKLYFSRGACSLAVRIVLHEIGISCDFEAVDLKTKKTETGADYFKINPKGAVPALELNDGNILTENSAIQQFLADEYDAVQLLPPVGDFRRYRVVEWLNFVSTDLHKGFGPLFNPNVPENIKSDIFIPILKSKFKLVDQHLAKNKYLLNEEFTLPDGYLFVLLLWFKNFKMDLQEWTNLVRFMGDMKTRKSVQKALMEEKINLG